VSAETLLSVAVVPKVRGTAIVELALPMLTVPKFVPNKGLADSTVKLCVTVSAAAYTTPSPGWLAWMVQVPAASSVAVEAADEAVQMVGVVEVKLTGSPESAQAFNVIETDVLIIWAGIALNMIVWASRLTVKLWVTVGAAA
jgi:hypothetical protein